MEDHIRTEVNNTARKKKRRSSFIDRHLLVNPSLLENPLLESVDNEVVKVPIENSSFESMKSKEVNEYLKKLKNEKKNWIGYEKLLHSKYSRTKKCEIIDLNKYLEYLPKEDRDYLEMLDNKVNEYNNLQKVELPKINELSVLMKYEFDKEVKISKLIKDCFKTLMKVLQDFTFEKYFDDESWDYDEFEIENFTEEYGSEDLLYIEGV